MQVHTPSPPEMSLHRLGAVIFSLNTQKQPGFPLYPWICADCICDLCISCALHTAVHFLPGKKHLKSYKVLKWHTLERRQLRSFRKFLKPDTQALFPSQVYASNKDTCVTKTHSLCKAAHCLCRQLCSPSFNELSPLLVGGCLIMWLCLSWLLFY